MAFIVRGPQVCYNPHQEPIKVDEKKTVDFFRLFLWAPAHTCTVDHSATCLRIQYYYRSDNTP